MGETEKTVGIGMSPLRKDSLVHWKSMLKGLLAGSLIVGSVINPTGFAAVILFLIGLYVLIDTIVPYGEQPYPVLTVGFALLGSIIAFAFSAAGLGIPYLVLAVVLTLLVYLSKIRGVYALRNVSR
jgi:hypothetical protein